MNSYAFVRNRPSHDVDSRGLEVSPNGVPPPGDPVYVAILQSYSATGSTTPVDLSAVFTRWYETRFPETTRHSRATLPSMVGVAVDAACDRHFRTFADGQAPSIYIGNYSTGQGGAIRPDDIDESAK